MGWAKFLADFFSSQNHPVALVAEKVRVVWCDAMRAAITFRCVTGI
jgi:hypothetical protein